MTHLQLGDGSKMISHGKCPHVCTRVGSTGGEIDFAVTNLLTGVNVALGTNWLEVCDPLISWKAHKLWIKGVHGIEKYLAKVYLQI